MCETGGGGERSGEGKRAWALELCWAEILNYSWNCERKAWPWLGGRADYQPWQKIKRNRTVINLVGDMVLLQFSLWL